MSPQDHVFKPGLQLVALLEEVTEFSDMGSG